MTLDRRWGIGDGSPGAQARRAGVFALAVAVLSMGAAAVLAPARAGTSNALTAGSGARVILYGDSLAWEAEASFRGALAADDFSVTTETFGGTAMCDWLPQMRLDAAHVRPQAIVVEFSGNAITPCMRALDGAPLTGAAYFEAYAAAARSVL